MGNKKSLSECLVDDDSDIFENEKVKEPSPSDSPVPLDFKNIGLFLEDVCPNEIILLMFEYLQFLEVIRIGGVSKLFKTLSQTWLKNRKITDSDFAVRTIEGCLFDIDWEEIIKDEKVEEEDDEDEGEESSVSKEEEKEEDTKKPETIPLQWLEFFIENETFDHEMMIDSLFKEILKNVPKLRRKRRKKKMRYRDKLVNDRWRKANRARFRERDFRRDVLCLISSKCGSSLSSPRPLLDQILHPTLSNSLKLNDEEYSFSSFVEKLKEPLINSVLENPILSESSSEIFRHVFSERKEFGFHVRDRLEILCKHPRMDPKNIYLFKNVFEPESPLTNLSFFDLAQDPSKNSIILQTNDKNSPKHSLVKPTKHNDYYYSFDSQFFRFCQIMNIGPLITRKTTAFLLRNDTSSYVARNVSRDGTKIVDFEKWIDEDDQTPDVYEAAFLSSPDDGKHRDFDDSISTILARSSQCPIRLRTMKRLCQKVVDQITNPSDDNDRRYFFNNSHIYNVMKHGFEDPNLTLLPHSWIDDEEFISVLLKAMFTYDPQHRDDRDRYKRNVIQNIHTNLSLFLKLEEKIRRGILKNVHHKEVLKYLVELYRYVDSSDGRENFDVLDVVYNKLELPNSIEGLSFLLDHNATNNLLTFVISETHDFQELRGNISSVVLNRLFTHSLENFWEGQQEAFGRKVVRKYGLRYLFIILLKIFGDGDEVMLPHGMQTYEYVFSRIEVKSIVRSSLNVCSQFVWGKKVNHRHFSEIDEDYVVADPFKEQVITLCESCNVYVCAECMVGCHGDHHRKSDEESELKRKKGRCECGWNEKKDDDDDEVFSCIRKDKKIVINF